MKTYKSHQIQINNIPTAKCYCRNTTKSFRTLVFVAIVTLTVFNIVKNKIFSIPLFLYFLFLVFRPEELVLAMYEGFVVYYSDDKEYYEIIYYSEIDRWKYDKKFLASTVTLNLTSGEEITINKGLNALTYYVFEHHLKSKKKVA